MRTKSGSSATQSSALTHSGQPALAFAGTQQALDFVAHGALQAFAGTIAGQVEAQAGLFLALQGAASGQRQFGKVVAHDRCSLSRRQAISDYCTFIQ